MKMKSLKGTHELLCDTRTLNLSTYLENMTSSGITQTPTSGSLNQVTSVVGPVQNHESKVGPFSDRVRDYWLQLCLNLSITSCMNSQTILEGAQLAHTAVAIFLKIVYNVVISSKEYLKCSRVSTKHRAYCIKLGTRKFRRTTRTELTVKFVYNPSNSRESSSSEGWTHTRARWQRIVSQFTFNPLYLSPRRERCALHATNVTRHT